MKNICAALWLLLLWPTALPAQLIPADSAFIASNYIKWEKLIPMRDGIQLFTSIYLPKDSADRHPILLTRTPYSCAPYGENQFRALWRTNHGLYAMQKYIIVFQDVRGRYMSEGEFEDVRPFRPMKTGNETDEASDTYDTIEWLLRHLPGNNGNVGVFGISYPGFYSTMAALSKHPNLKAVSPQAPVTDWFMGDDFHHNGAFMLIDAFEFYKSFGVPRPKPTAQYSRGFVRTEPDAYKFYLSTGALANFNTRYLGDSIAFWNTLMNQPVYNEWWQSGNPRNHVAGIKAAMLVVGGLFDAEDCYGAWRLYEAIEQTNHPSLHNKVVMGPWFHGAWGGRSAGERLGDIRFGAATSTWYQQNIEFPFFEHFLRGKPGKEIAEATVFFTGENTWRTFENWPPAQMQETAMYFHPGRKLSFKRPVALESQQKPTDALTFASYISDPKNPVPHEGTDTIKRRTTEYMTADQRFASKRKDVITFKTAALREPLTLAGTLVADLMISTSATDIDLVVKLIDEFPSNIHTTGRGADTVYLGAREMNGYQMLVRGEVMRSKFRNSFENPEPIVPGKITQVRFSLPDVAHTFLPGHKLVVQVQSSWFPLVDRNPQVFTDIYKATDADFKPAEVRIYHTNGVASKIMLPVISK